MGSHSVTCHPPLLQPVSWYSIYLSWRDRRLSWPRLPSNAPAENRTRNLWITFLMASPLYHWADQPMCFAVTQLHILGFWEHFVYQITFMLPAQQCQGTKECNRSMYIQESCAIAKMTVQCALYMVPLKFSGLPDYAHCYYSQHFHGLLFWSTLWMFLLNLKSIALPVPDIIGGTQKICAVPGYAHAPFCPKL